MGRLKILKFGIYKNHGLRHSELIMEGYEVFYFLTEYFDNMKAVFSRKILLIFFLHI